MASFIAKLKKVISSITNEIEQIPDGAVLLDVRSPKEHATGTLKNSILIPMSDIANQQLVANKLPDTATPIVVYCASGGRAIKCHQS